MYASILMTVFIFALLSLLPIYSLVKMIRSFRKENSTTSVKAVATGNAFDVLLLIGILFIMLIGYAFNYHSEAGGNPLRVMKGRANR